MSQSPISALSEPSWPTNCAEAQAVVFRLRRNGLELLPGMTTDTWASSVLSWASNGHARRCVGVAEIAA